MQICRECGSEFPTRHLMNAVRLNLHGRKRCLGCLPHRPQRKPRKRVARPVRIKTCESCGQRFPAKLIIDGSTRSLYRRRFCLRCSPFGTHNTSKSPPGIASPEELQRHRHWRRNAKIYRYTKKRRQRLKAELIEAHGGRCVMCGYGIAVAALEFHHRNPTTKEFGLGNFSGSRERLFAEAQKCDLLCASCHRLRHAVSPLANDSAAKLRREKKARAIAHMGGVCFACGRDGPPSLFEFHHRNGNEKEFGISENGIVRTWDKIVAELAKCVMLCANCHREVHAGVRRLDLRSSGVNAWHETDGS